MKDRYKSDMYSGGGKEWSCKYFDGICCELYLLHKRQLTSCRGIYYNCMKQGIRNGRDK
jgi:hypothetical protein